jgi:hypothetical protein
MGSSLLIGYNIKHFHRMVLNATWCLMEEAFSSFHVSIFMHWDVKFILEFCNRSVLKQKRSYLVRLKNIILDKNKFEKHKYS